MQEKTIQHLNMKGLVRKRPFTNELLNDIYVLQKQEGDTEGMRMTQRIYRQERDFYYSK